MCEQQFDFVCAHIARLKQTDRKRKKARKREWKEDSAVVTLPAELVWKMQVCTQRPSRFKLQFCYGRTSNDTHTHMHRSFTQSVYTQVLCGSLLEMQLIPLSGQICNSNLTIDLYILSVINHRLCSLNKSNTIHTSKLTFKNTQCPYHTPTSSHSSHTHTHTHTKSTQYGCITSFIYL